MYNIHHFHNALNRHPLYWVRQLVDFYVKNNMASQGLTLSFSKYKYTPQSFSDERVNFTLPFNQLNEVVLFNIISGLHENEELAFHSFMQDFGSVYHLPLIDFGNVDRGRIESSPFRELCEHWNLSFRVYNSGRSYHAYGNKLISSDEWVRFMGSLLLLNKPSGFKLIDERWVGHRVMAGYSALRWSNNSSHYKKVPTFIGVLNSYGFEMDSVSN